eukprot:TRINITY_DN30_c1_g2_i1.p1 TRINITY_DN30_c1_g2~~TRINITY_DN30_c1_g2_i1.p1  ORF type:complete len:246 (-),score=78.14 TRINITY_DN30_c1_g2_i1:155-892(-)
MDNNNNNNNDSEPIKINGVAYPQLHLLKMNYQLKGLLTIIRDKTTPRDQFIFYSNRLIRLLIEEGLSYLPFEEKTIITPTGSEYKGVQFSSKICGVSMVRAGESMEAGLRQVCQKIRIGKILIVKNEENGKIKTQALYAKFPSDISERKVLLLDPMLATGASVKEAIRVLISSGVKQENILFLNLICAPEGIKSLTEKYSKIEIVSCEIDDGINENGISLPGIGDFGDRYFGTEGIEIGLDVSHS